VKLNINHSDSPYWKFALEALGPFLEENAYKTLTNACNYFISDLDAGCISFAAGDCFFALYQCIEDLASYRYRRRRTTAVNFKFIDSNTYLTYKNS
jgi:hypothetical protein